MMAPEKNFTPRNKKTSPHAFFRHASFSEKERATAKHFESLAF